MNFSTYVFLINPNLRCVRTSYEPTDHKGALFKTLDKGIVKGDLVVVPTNTRVGMTVVKVEDVDVGVDFDSTAPMSWVIARVDKDAYEVVLKEEEEVISALRMADQKKKQKDLAAALFDANPELAARLSNLSISALPPK